jgi:CMP-N-acetylneuraminic acid synthetase
VIAERVLGVVPARGGSKGIPRKNIAPLGGRPLIAHAIQAARGSRRLSRTIISTDDAEICEVARAWGGDVPFLRPAELSTDTATAVDVACHAVLMAESEEKTRYEIVCLLEPTSPLRTSEDIDSAVDLLTRTQADAVIAVYRIESPHPAKTLKIENDRLTPYFQGESPSRLRQALPSAYAVNGAIYCVRREVLTEQKSFWGAVAVPYVMPAERSVNIDRPLDLRFAEFLLRDMG